MSTQFSQPNEPVSRRRIVDASAYSARVQEAMRYDKLPSPDYVLVMTILDAVLQGYTEKRWEETQQRALQTLRKQSPDKKSLHADASDHYEQIVSSLKDLSLWPWE